MNAVHAGTIEEAQEATAQLLKAQPGLGVPD
jgi:hypothetical protein